MGTAQMFRDGMKFAFVMTACLAALASHLSAQEKPRQPNILVIVADDLGYADLGFQGGKDIPTPNIDSIAAGGARFTNGYVSGPYCSPTRAGMLTGRYQQRFGHEFNPGGEGGGGGNGLGLPLSEATIANRLQQAGYVTGLVGKWHLGSGAKLHPMQRGFDEFYGFLGGAHTYFDKQEAAVMRGTTRISEPEYLTDAFGREAVSFIERNQQKPFFLYLAFNAVHTPMEADKDRLAKFSSIASKPRQTYAGMLSAMDDAVGKVLKTLRASQLEENTLIFFISDNGGPTMQGTTINSSINTPLRGSKRTTLEGGVHVPFLVYWKGKITPGTVLDQPVIQLDIQPTALAAAGIEVKPEWKLDGVNLLPFIKGQASGKPHETLYWRLGEQNAIRHGDWKLVQYDLNVDNYPTKGVTAPRLYNLKDDIGETHDLAEKHPEKVAELTSLWNAWSSEMVEPLWGGQQNRRQNRDTK
jgi:arylsulfatase A-like enzyme